MSETLTSVGLDVGTTTTQMIVSRLTVENQASAFAVPDMTISKRQVLYRSKVHFTPLVNASLVDGNALRKLVEEEYRMAGICRESVDTGAVIITGETSRKENAAQVLSALSDLAGEFVVATAGPDLESVLAAKGAGAEEYSAKTGKTVLHIDIGGGTSNLALIEEGRVVRTGCLNVGGRLLKLDTMGRISYVSPVLKELTPLQVGDTPSREQIEAVAELLTRCLEMAAGLRPPTALLEKLMTEEATTPWQPPEKGTVISFSGGVAACMQNRYPDFAFGDIGPVLGRKIADSFLCKGEYMLGEETIRATVIGAGSHSTQLSGSTVFYRNVTLPLKNLPVAVISKQEQESEQLVRLIGQRLQEKDADAAVLYMPGYRSPSYRQVRELAQTILAATAGKPVLICLETDMAKALGQAIQLHLQDTTPCLCIDSLRLTPESFLDIGAPVGPCLPVVIKTLVLDKRRTT